jgi:hypothetical protein
MNTTEKNILMLEALQNAVNYQKVDGLKIQPYIENDKRKKESRFVLSLNGTCISPVLNYDNMNHFILGFGKSLKISREKEAEKLPTNEQADDVHEKLRSILFDYGNEEFGDCIVDEISSLFGLPTTNDVHPKEEEAIN